MHYNALSLHILLFSENVNCVEFIAGQIKKRERKKDKQTAGSSVHSSPFSKSAMEADWLANEEPRK